MRRNDIYYLVVLTEIGIILIVSNPYEMHVKDTWENHFTNYLASVSLNQEIVKLRHLEIMLTL